MATIDQFYRSSLLFNQSIPTTDTFNSSFNYSTAENLYGSNVLLYTGLIPTTNPLTSSGDGAKYSVDGIDIVEKLDKQVLEGVEDSFFAFSHSRMTYVIPGSVYGITLWAKDSSGAYTVQIPQKFYDIFFYEKEQRYVVYFNQKYLPIYSNGTLDNPTYAPAITCYRYCGPKGIENLAGGSGSQGPQGASGPQGATGSAGTQGTQGTQGLQGSAGTQGFQGSAGTQGTQGLQGLQGVSGTQGTQGTQGLQGSAGTQGLQGATGSTGTQGLQGARGFQGFQGAAGSLTGTQYIYVVANGTDTQNATELQNAYNTAKTMSPSLTNRITVVCGPGNYNFGSTPFTMDTQYIDLVSLDGNASVIFNSGNSAGTISITASDVFVKGVDVGTKRFTIATNLNSLRVENCKGGDYSWGSTSPSSPITVSGTFTNCTGGDVAFGGNGTASGIFTGCTGGDYSFGYSNASGTFTDCSAGMNSFGADTASGIFTRCHTPTGTTSYSFGAFSTGTFIGCTGGEGCFGGDGGDATGTFIDCRVGPGSFAGGVSFSGGTASGLFVNCSAGMASFAKSDSGSADGTLSGKLFYCRITESSNVNNGLFPTVSGGGRTYYCVDGYGNTNNQ